MGEQQETRILNSGEPCLIAPFSCFEGCLFNHSIRRTCFNESREVAAAAFCVAFFFSLSPDCISCWILARTGSSLGNRGESRLFSLLLLVTTFVMHRWDGMALVVACCDEYGYRRFEIGSTFAFARIPLRPLHSCLPLFVRLSDLYTLLLYLLVWSLLEDPGVRSSLFSFVCYYSCVLVAMDQLCTIGIILSSFLHSACCIE